MPSSPHEGMVHVFEQGPKVVVELLRARSVELPHFEAARADRVCFADLKPPEYRSDLVVVLETDGEPQFVVIVEVQLEKDDDKLYSWPAYLAVGRARYKCPAAVLVFSPVPSVATWAAQPIPLGPANTFRAHVFGPGGIPVVDDAQQARQDVELAVLSALCQERTSDKEEVPRAAEAAAATLDACSTLPDDRAVLYSDLLLAWFSQAVREALMSIPAGYQFQSEFARKHQALGRAEAVLAVLDARGLAVTDEQRKRIEGTTDLEVLDRLVRNAATVDSTDELFED